MKSTHGFTLIEVMIATAIVGVLVAIALPKFDVFRMKALRLEGITLAQSVHLAELNYYVTYEKFVCYEASKPAAEQMFANNLQFAEILGLADFIKKMQIKYYVDLAAVGNNNPTLGPIGYNFLVYGEIDDDLFKDILFIRSEFDQSALFPALNQLDFGIWHLISNDLTNQILVQ